MQSHVRFQQTSIWGNQKGKLASIRLLNWSRKRVKSQGECRQTQASKWREHSRLEEDKETSHAKQYGGTTTQEVLRAGGHPPFHTLLCPSSLRNSSGPSRVDLSYQRALPTAVASICRNRSSRRRKPISPTQYLQPNSGSQTEVCCASSPLRSNDHLKLIDENGGYSTVIVDDKPFQCSVCEKSFKRAWELFSHEVVHNSDRPFHCDICQTCGKAFKQSSYLVIHQRAHTGEKPYQCDVCQKAFTRPSLLLQHHRVHSQERPFKCGFCDKYFKDYSYLTVHEKVWSHGGVAPEELRG
uniref:C2H2-type domain-containing protein n=1 Tax=Erpetoichthys calabaricus TaxID=27687 RepID=A0A8C4T6R0_ERPCA